MFSIIKRLFQKSDINLGDLIRNGAMIIDVRSQAEFKNGHTRGAINIPLNELDNYLTKIKSKDKTIITCCRSGIRSAKAANILKSVGVTAYNGGSWGQVQRMLDQE